MYVIPIVDFPRHAHSVSYRGNSKEQIQAIEHGNSKAQLKNSHYQPDLHQLQLPAAPLLLLCDRGSLTDTEENSPTAKHRCTPREKCIADASSRGYIVFIQAHHHEDLSCGSQQLNAAQWLLV